VAILLEWILARMVLHPVIQAKVQAEIDNVVGSSRSVSDFVLPNLPYLRAVVRETLRVLPPGPLLIIFTAAINILTKISCVCVCIKYCRRIRWRWNLSWINLKKITLS
jgi:hypothetical protein